MDRRPFRFLWSGALLNAEAEQVLIRMALISYGAVTSYQTRTSHGRADGGRPFGEARPLHDYWAAVFEATAPEDMFAAVEAATVELENWIRRPFAPVASETLEELCARIVGDGWGVSADDCARAMRCTPTLVRRARLGALRHPETGYRLPERQRDPMAWAIQLDRVGLSLRQIEAATGVPKSTLHDYLSRPRRAAVRRGIVG